MFKGLLRTQWVQQIAVAVAYLVAYELIKQISQSIWSLNDGLQVVVLLMTPYRYWGAILVGESIPNALFAFDCLPQFGLAWSVMRAFPNMLLAMPVVWYFRSQLHVFPNKRLVDIKVLLVMLGTLSAVWASYSVELVSLGKVVPPEFKPSPLIFASFFAGNFTGVLTVVPLALIARFDLHGFNMRDALDKVVKSPLLSDGLFIAAPVMIMMAFGAARISGQSGALIEMAMFVPAIWLTVRHGWRATAVAGTVILICNGLIHPDAPDPGTVLLQAILTLGVAGLYALGAQVSVKKAREGQEHQHVVEQQTMIRQNLAASERRMRSVAQQMEFIAGNLSVMNSRLIEQLRRAVPNIESDPFYKRVTKAHEQVYALAESLHPVAWRERGLPAALTETIARVLDEAGMSYRCEVSGRGFMSMESDVLAAVYRLACEAVAHVSENLTCSGVHLKVRGGSTNGKRWIGLRVKGLLDENGVAKSVFYADARRLLGPALGASAPDVEQMRNYAKVYGGCLHTRSTPAHYVLSCLLQGRTPQIQDQTPASGRLWVG